MEKKELKFKSYDGEFPCLCMGTLIFELNGKEIIFPEHCLTSGGDIDDDWETICGSWCINEYPEDFPIELKEYAEELVNENIEYGCCGGCI